MAFGPAGARIAAPRRQSLPGRWSARHRDLVAGRGRVAARTPGARGDRQSASRLGAPSDRSRSADGGSSQPERPERTMLALRPVDYAAPTVREGKGAAAALRQPRGEAGGGGCRGAQSRPGPSSLGAHIGSFKSGKRGARLGDPRQKSATLKSTPRHAVYSVDLGAPRASCTGWSPAPRPPRRTS
jgi:hypothetical protein